MSLSGSKPRPRSRIRSRTVPSSRDSYDARPARLRVLACVRQGLLRDPEKSGLDRRGQASVSEPLLVVDLPTLVAKPLHLLAHRGGEPEVVERRRSEVRDDPARLAYGPLHEPQSEAQNLLTLRGARGVAPRVHLQVLVGGGGQEDALRRLLDDRAVEFLALTQGFLGSSALGDIPGVDDDAPYVLVVEQVVADGFEVAPRALFAANPILHR